MKKIYTVTVVSFLFFTSFSQDFLGISTGNFSGVSGVMLQPASIVDSRHKFDINLFSASFNYSNNYFLVNRDAILKFNKNNFNDYQTFKKRYLSEASLPAGERVFLNINNRTQVPLSFMATTGKKSAIALNIQSRSMIQGRGITQELAKMAYNGFYSPALNNNTIDASGINIKALNWAEVGFTYGRVLYASDKHFFKAAVTGKYLAGVASISMASNDIRFGVNNDSSMNFNTNRFDYNHNKNADFDMVFDKNFSPDANALGVDAGLVYEYRGNFQKFKYIRNDDEKSYLADRRDVNKYIFKLGVSLVDVGMFRFQKPDNVNSFSANITNWNIASANYNTIRDFDTALGNRVLAIPGSRFYNTYLPAALSVQFDLRFVKGFYLNAMAYRPVKIGKDAGERFNSYGFYTITPRWESRHIGIYIPYTIADKNSLTNYQGNLLGATVRLGPLFIGSSNLGTMLFNENLKAADVHVGLKIGITHGKPNKSSTYLDRVFSKKEDSRIPVTTNVINTIRDTLLIQRNDTSRLLIDYNKGKVYDHPNSKGNIIIVNNYYYGNSPVTSVIKSDSISNQALLVQYYEQLNKQKDSIQLQMNKEAFNQNKKLITDSINYKKQQLDSLILEMQLLRIQMDSGNVKDSSGVGIFKKKSQSFIIIDSNNAVIQQSANRLAPGKFVNPVADSMALAMRKDSFAASKASVKKKSFDSTNISTATNDPGTAKASNGVILNNQQKAAKLQRGSANTSDSMTLLGQMDSLAGNNAIINRKGSKSSKIKAPANEQATAKTRSVPVLNDQQKEVKLQIVTTPVADRYSLQNALDQERLLNEYKNESGRIRRDIARLQASNADNNRNYRGNNNLVPIVIPGAKNDSYVNATAGRRDTIYIRDTIKQLDTVRISDTDTVRLLVDKPVVERGSAKQAPAPQRILRDTIVKQAVFDYTAMPETVVLFGLGKSAVQQVYFKRLDFIADILIKENLLQVSVSGHSDKTGSPEINRALSLKRAQNISTYLISRGVSGEKINTTAVSYLEPAVKGNSNNANMQNRRVVVKFLTGK